MTINIWRLQFLIFCNINIIIVFREAKDQGQTSLIKFVDILPLTDLTEVSNMANESWDDFQASVPRFAAT